MRITASTRTIMAMMALVVSSVAFSAEPDTFKQAISTYEAEFGGNLASAPKIRPDGKFYYLYGKIYSAGEKPSFFANRAPSEENELISNVLRRSRGMGEITEYFTVIVPDNLQDYYFDNAKIGGGFDLIGRYVSNTKYNTVAGHEMQAPVFEAVYLDLWSKRQTQSIISPQRDSAPQISDYAKCINNAEGVMPEMIDCANEEATRQDARLNAAYKVAMVAITDKNTLRTRQRQWIKERDKECELDNDGGQMAILIHLECVARKSAVRADELEAMK